MATPAATSTGWSVAKHDTIPAADITLAPFETHVYLRAFLDSDGAEFVKPYSAVRDSITKVLKEAELRERPAAQAPSADVADQRLRTWKAVFEHLGFLTVGNDQRVQLTHVGRTLRQLYQDLYNRIEGANDHIAKLAVDVLSRHRLKNPLDGGDYPDDADVHPFRLIWKAMRRLDNRLHWEELNRVLMKVNYSRDEDAAIEAIKAVRKTTGGEYDKKALAALGPPVVDEGDETKRRITPWFTRAGFGGLLITPDADAAGFRELVPKYVPLIDDALQRDVVVPKEALATPEAYLAYVTEAPSAAAKPTSPTDITDLQKVLDAVKLHGSTKIITLSGLPGTGKSRLARMAVEVLTGNDPYRFEEIQFHETTSYDDFMEGFVPKPSGEGFELRRKVFRILNRRAAKDPTGATYVLLIEELTRANVHAVLGELLTYVEHRNRVYRMAVSQEEEKVAPNLVILATMNPRDKSAMVLDHAILRRLHQVVLPPSTERLHAMLQPQLDAAVLAQLEAWFDKHAATLPFGHGSFANVKSAADLKDIWYGTLRYFLTDVTGDVKPSFIEIEKSFPWR